MRQWRNRKTRSTWNRVVAPAKDKPRAGSNPACRTPVYFTPFGSFNISRLPLVFLIARMLRSWSFILRTL